MIRRRAARAILLAVVLGMASFPVVQAVAQDGSPRGDRAHFEPIADGPSPADTVSFSELVRRARHGEVERFSMEGEHVGVATFKDGHRSFVSTPLAGFWAMDLAGLTDVDFGGISRLGTFEIVAGYVTLIGQLLVAIVLVVGLAWLTRALRSKVGAGTWVIPGKGKARAAFSDVAGAEEGKAALHDIVAYLRDPDRFDRLGAQQRRGILLYGPPGNGKTLLARAVAGEANVPFLSVTGSAFQEMFAGLGAARVRWMFAALRRKSPAILFIDEVDSVARQRSQGSSAVENDSAGTLNQLLTEMDGLSRSRGIVVIAATNRADVLDAAFVRAGRFDLHVEVPNPNAAAREAILEVHLRDRIVDPDVDIRAVARGTPTFSGADLMTLVNEAAHRAVKRDADALAMRDFDAARDAKLLGGDERTSLVLSPEELDTVAYHEAGHALVATLVQGCDPVDKATILPRGRALGHVAALPVKERVLVDRRHLRAQMTMLMAGRAAEEIKFGDERVTSGAANDIETVTRMAREMIARYGMGTSLASRVDGPGAFAMRPISERTKHDVDVEVDALVKDCHANAKLVVGNNMVALEALVLAFKEEETLSGDRIRKIVGESAIDKKGRLAAAE